VEEAVQLLERLKRLLDRPQVALERLLDRPQAAPGQDERAGLGAVIADLRDRGGDQQEHRQTPQPLRHRPLRSPDQDAVRKSDRHAGQGTPGVSPVIDDRDHLAEHRGGDQQPHHLAAEKRANPGPRPPADDRAERHQPEDHRRPPAPGPHRVRPQRVPHQRRQEVTAETDHHVDRQELPGPVPSLHHRSELVHHVQVHPDMEETIVDERGRQGAPDLSLEQVVVRQLAKRVTAPHADEKFVQLGRVALHRLVQDHQPEDDDPE